MPLPPDGAVVGYTIELGDRTITGEIEKLDEARQAYRDALAKGHTAGLLCSTRTKKGRPGGALVSRSRDSIRIRGNHRGRRRRCARAPR